MIHSMNDIRCEKCNQLLSKDVVWLALDQRTHTYTDNEDGIPEDLKMGYFPFGVDCAKKMIAEHKRKVGR